MKKSLLVLSGVLCAAAMLSVGCKKGGDDASAKGDASKSLVVWSFTDELSKMIDAPGYGYKAAHQDITVEYSLTPTDQFPNKLDPVLASGNGCPDVFALENAFVRKYIEEGPDLLLPLDDVYAEIKDKMADYPMQIGSYNGHVYGMAWQVCPGAVFYRRSLAKEFLGTDDPVEVQKAMADLSKFLELAETIKTKSNGTVDIVSSTGDLFMPYKGARKDPWVVNGKLVIDPAMDQFMEMSKLMHDNHYDARVGQWSEGWFAGMKDALTDETGKNVKVFCYFLPTWGLHYTLKPNAGDTAGDWAMCAGPANYFWGGTWIAAYKGTKNPNAAKEMIKYLVSNDNFCENYAKETGDTLGNYHTQEAIKNDFSESFLGGQNHFAAFCEMAKGVDGKLVQGTDQAIEALWNEAVAAYANGEKSKDQALNDFKAQVSTQLGF